MAEVKEFVTKDSGARQEFPTGARRDTGTGKGRYDLVPSCCIARLAKLYERGAAKYGDFNWSKGIPSSRYAESGMRHFYQYLDGDRTEDHLSAVAFNVFGIIFNEEMADRGVTDGSLNNLPRFVKPTPTNVPALTQDLLAQNMPASPEVTEAVTKRGGPSSPADEAKRY